MSLSILVIDDSDAEQFLCRCVIEEFDDSITVLEATNGEKALALLRSLETPPQVIFLDLNMPVMNGFEFLETYDNDETLKKSNVITLSTTQHEKDIKKAEEYKCVSRCIEKPLLPEYLEEILAPYKE